MCVLNESDFSSLTGDDLLNLVFIKARGTIARLDLGANLLFANCGRGDALVELARQFPRSRFFGLESSRNDLGAAGAAVRASWLQNLWIEPNAGSLPYLAGIFQFALRRPHPRGAGLADIASLLRSGGLLFDLHHEPPASLPYDEAALTVLYNASLPDGFCTVARK